MEMLPNQNNHFSIYIGDRHVILAKQVNHKYICKFCDKIMNDPVQTSRGELACRKCYKEKQVINPGYCPIDGEPIKDIDIFPDKSVSREISKLECLCENEKNGCTWKGALSDINSHEVSCEYISVTCNACGEKFIKWKSEEHKSEKCPKREVPCSNCNKIIPYEETQLHEEFCEERPIECPFKCGSMIARTKMFSHTHNCKNILAGNVCPYTVVGCTHEINDDETLSIHLQNSEMLHAALVVEKLVFLECDNKRLIKIHNELERNYQQLQKELEKLESSHQSVMSEQVIEQLKSQIKTKEQFATSVDDVQCRLTKYESSKRSQTEREEQIETLLSIQSNLNDMLKKEQFSPLVDYNNNLNRVSKEVENCRKEIEKLDINSAMASSNLADMELKLQLLENTSYNGRQLWKIDNFKYRMSQAEKGKITALHSAPSFTEVFGYKFCTRLYLNGDGIGKNTHLSIFFVVMKSQYDELLKWPFVKRISFRLLNHEDVSKTRKESFLSDRNSSSFQRPTKEMNIAAGCPMFVEKSRLENDGFIINDSLFIETKVEDDRRPNART